MKGERTICFEILNLECQRNYNSMLSYQAKIVNFTKHSGKIAFSNHCSNLCSKNLRGNDPICVSTHGRLDSSPNSTYSQGPLSFSPSGPWEWGWFGLFCSCDITVTFGYVTCGHGHIVDSSYQIVLTDITYKINFLP